MWVKCDRKSFTFSFFFAIFFISLCSVQSNWTPLDSNSRGKRERVAMPVYAYVCPLCVCVQCIRVHKLTFHCWRGEREKRKRVSERVLSHPRIEQVSYCVSLYISLSFAMFNVGSEIVSFLPLPRLTFSFLSYFFSPFLVSPCVYFPFSFSSSSPSISSSSSSSFTRSNVVFFFSYAF